eukprot:CAMPEP_0113857122 /NCGR_PEP_ID=MMETSP0372-20130328/9873_1 /TAXON_ID=340204 /ORGANISM="Lankesteria abbotti" /LENGTH=52 /DNA_ID=CAMNT_0000832713 /DNA_START=35 /DNA_END=189 /DNA_ORIENTATION=- /assembly_acc=CAM_ASM_000359
MEQKLMKVSTNTLGMCDLLRQWSHQTRLPDILVEATAGRLGQGSLLDEWPKL